MNETKIPLNTLQEPIITEGEDAQKRREIRVNKPLEKIKEYLTTTNFSSWKEEHLEFIKKIQNEPYNTYKELKDRLIIQGQMASFPEFKGVVAYLIEALFQSDIYIYYQGSQDKIVQLEVLMHKLIAIMTKSRYFFPYVSSLYTIESMLILLDSYYRDTSKEPLPNFYHNFRYRSYLDYIILGSNPENIVIPTYAPTGATFFIKIRCVPILMLGVTSEPTWADQYLNSPLDFWAHDVQHARRQIQETSAYYDRYVKHQAYYTKRDPFNIITQEQFYYNMNQFTQKFLIPIITIIKGDTEKIKSYKKIIKLIIFEVVHEKAWPVTSLAICRCIPLLYDLFPVESLTIVDENGKKYLDTVEQTFSDPTTLSNLRGKIRHGFYDQVDDINEAIVPETYRTSQNITICAKILLTLLGCKCNPDMSLLLKLTKDTTNAAEFSQATSIQSPDIPNDSYDTTYTQDEINKLNSCDNLLPSNIVTITDVLTIPVLPENLNDFMNQDFSNEPPTSAAQIDDQESATNTATKLGGLKRHRFSKTKNKKHKSHYKKTRRLK
jgi:hypothetical protein